MAGIVLVAMLVVISTLIKILISEHRRRVINWGSPELLLFAITGVGAIAVLWVIMAFRWFQL